MYSGKKIVLFLTHSPQFDDIRSFGNKTAIHSVLSAIWSCWFVDGRHISFQWISFKALIQIKLKCRRRKKFACNCSRPYFLIKIYILLFYVCTFFFNVYKRFQNELGNCSRFRQINTVNLFMWNLLTWNGAMEWSVCGLSARIFGVGTINGTLWLQLNDVSNVPLT